MDEASPRQCQRKLKDEPFTIVHIARNGHSAATAIDLLLAFDDK